MKILFTSTLNTPFILEDLTTLRRHFDAEHLLTVGPLAPARISSAVRRSDVTFTWFASVYSFLVVRAAARQEKRSIIVVGGVDAARMPEIGYGIWLSPWKGALVSRALRNAWRVLVVDEFLKGRVCSLAGYGGDNIRVVPTGYDAAFWIPGGVKEAEVVTVAACQDRPRFLAKGVDLFIECARRMPQTRFRVVGLGPEIVNELRNSFPANLELLPYLQPSELRDVYRRAKVYCQPSRSEGLPNSLCEAMLCGCVAVGSSIGGIPTAIGDSGHLVPPERADELVRSIETALKASPVAGEKGRERIAGLFPRERRERALVDCINEALQ